MLLCGLSLLNQEDTCWKQIYSSPYIWIAHTSTQYFKSMLINYIYFWPPKWNVYTTQYVKSYCIAQRGEKKKIQSVCSSSPQHFQHQGQGPVCGRQFFPRAGLGWGGVWCRQWRKWWGEADEASLPRPPLTSCCAAQFLTGHGLVPVYSPGVGDPWFAGHILS